MFELERTAQLWGITGNLGGGKTLTAVQFAVTAMSQGFYVCTNVTLNMERVSAYYGEFTRKLYCHISLDDPLFDPFKLPCGSPRGSGGRKRVLVILDECAEWVDQYSSAKDPRIARLWSWLRHSSKRSQDVFIIVQRPDYLNKVIRILISRWIWVNDLAVWRIPVLKMKFPFCGNLVMRNIFDGQKNRIGAVSFASKSFWGQFYNTAECLNSDGSTYADEYEVPKVAHYGRFWIVVLLVFSQLLLFSSISRSREVTPDPNYPDSSPPSILANTVSLSRHILSYSEINPLSAPHPLALSSVALLCRRCFESPISKRANGVDFAHETKDGIFPLPVNLNRLRLFFRLLCRSCCLDSPERARMRGARRARPRLV